MPKFTDENWEDVPSLLKTDEAADLLRVHRNTINTMISEGVLPSVLVGKRERRIKKIDLLRYIGEKVDDTDDKEADDTDD